MDDTTAPRRFNLKITWGLVALGMVSAIGTVGYKLIGGPGASWFDAFYMTVITITTVGFGEIIDFSHNPAGRVFTVFVLIAGLGCVWFLFSALTAFFLELDLNDLWRKRRMEKAIDKLSGHFIVCGFGRVGQNVAQELTHLGRPFVAIDAQAMSAHIERFPGLMFLQGDASDDDLLVLAGIERAAGIFAATGEDSRNLMVALTARQMNPGLRIVARAHEVRNAEKMRRAGADCVVSPDFTGGMRLATAMLHPVAAAFLDDMRLIERPVRIEEITVPMGAPVAHVGALPLTARESVLLAIRDGAQWVFNPPADFALVSGQTLIVMTTREGRITLQQHLAQAA